MGNNNNYNNNKKDLITEDKTEIKDEVKVTTETVKEEEPVKTPIVEEKKPISNKPIITNTISSKATAESEANIVMKKEIEKLEKNIKEWQDRVDRSQNVVDKTIHADKVAQAKLRIRELNDKISGKAPVAKDCPNVPKVKDPKPKIDKWTF